MLRHLIKVGFAWQIMLRDASILRTMAQARGSLLICVCIIVGMNQHMQLALLAAMAGSWNAAVVMATLWDV